MTPREYLEWAVFVATIAATYFMARSTFKRWVNEVMDEREKNENDGDQMGP